MTNVRLPSTPLWIRGILYLAGLYNLMWGAAVIAFPLAYFTWAEMEPPRYPQIWQCVGMIVGVYGIGYLLAARNPYRHWPIVAVGLLGKLLGPIGFLSAAWNGELPWIWGTTLLANDLAWWLPFGVILYHAFRYHSDTSRSHDDLDLTTALDSFVSHRGRTLGELSHDAPTLVVFLRHSGCTFCREALALLSDDAAAFKRRGIHLAIVHMSDPLDGTLMSRKYDLDDVHRIGDPQCVLYRAFGLQRGTLWQLLGPSVWWRGFSSFVRGHGLGMINGDGFRMPGSFIVVDGKIAGAYHSTTAADHPDYSALVDAILGNDDSPLAAAV